MKTLFLLLVCLLSITAGFSQVGKIQDPFSGTEMVLSNDKEYLVITSVKPGSPADIGKLRMGYRICEINGTKVSEISDPDAFFRTSANMPLRMEVKKIGDESFFVDLQRTSSDLLSPEVLTEAELYGLADPVQDRNYSTSDAGAKDIINEVENKILSSPNPNAYTLRKTDAISFLQYHLKRDIDNSNRVTILRDYNYNIYDYMTYDFEFLSQDDPLTEKTLLFKLEGYLQDYGLKRDAENPDILILISFYSGQQEQYVPPQQIISTKIHSYFNWYWGYVPVPVTESKTREGYTKTTYLTNISLKFLDFENISVSKTPPVIWSASYSEVSPGKKFITDYADEIYKYIMCQFPVVIQENSEDMGGNNYTYTGLIYNRNNPVIIYDVIPGSPAFQAGLRKGDEILAVNGRKLPESIPSEKFIIAWGRYGFSGPVITQNAWRYLFSRATFRDADPTLFKPLKDANEDYQSKEPLSFELKRGGRKIKSGVDPQYRKIVFFDDKGVSID
ncbi:MAG: PDZ domain-containing protein [Bacteroidales bacterium]|nr:PDZ domain-containing protein [Bacteroidales bacterium]